MGANIYFHQMKPVDGQSISCHAPSSFIASMERAFGEFPCVLDSENVPVLKGMAAMSHDGGGNPYQEIIDAIDKYGTIKVYAEW